MQLIILAAGKGSRMNSELPKVMHKIGDKSMLEMVIESCKEVTDDIILVYSDHLKPYLDQFSSLCKLVRQDPQLGTGHAVWVAKNLLSKTKPVGVMYGDNPLITSSIIKEIFSHMQSSESQVMTLAFDYAQENQYGRIITDKQGKFVKIVEAKNATPEELQITLCNSGVMTFAPHILPKYIDACLDIGRKIPGRELYLTDIVEVCSTAKEHVSYYLTQETKKVIGVNTQAELEGAQEIFHGKI